MKAVNIDVVGVPLNSREILWTQECPSGMRVSVLAGIEYGEFIMQSMKEEAAREKKWETALRQAFNVETERS